MHDTGPVWVKLRDHDPAPGVVIRWTERHGLPWADVTYEMNGRFRAERLPSLALRARRTRGAHLSRNESTTTTS